MALAGFLFGFDTVVISGADLSLQELWGRGAAFHGFVVMGSALWGTVIGALSGGYPTDRFGRKYTLIAIGILYLLSAFGSAVAGDPWVFAAMRFLGGLGVGASTVAAPAYVSEIAPPERRGQLVALYQFNIVFGILIAFLSNYLLSGIGPQAWRWMIGVEAVPALLYTLLVFTVPHSPRWLLTRGREAEAREVLRRLHGGGDAAGTKLRLETEGGGSSSGHGIFHAKYRVPLLLAFLIAFFNQFSGINAFLYYAPRIFEVAGLDQSSALLSSIGVGVVNLVFTLLGLFLIDRVGRRRLMYVGSVGYIVSLTLIALSFWQGWQGMAVPVFLFLFIAAHAVGQGTVIWVFIAEVFPNHLRGRGQSFGSSVHWVLAAVIPSLVPLLFARIGPAPVFGFFACMMVLQFLFVWRLMPETRGVALEDLEARLTTPAPSTHLQNEPA